MTQPSFTPLCDYPQTLLTQEQSEALIHIVMMEHAASEDDLVNLGEELQQNGGFLYQALHARATFHKVEVSPLALATVSEMCEGNIGKAMSILHSLVVRTPAGHQITATDFCNIFAGGVPVNENWNKFWDDQKAATGINQIDIGVWERMQ